MFSGGIEEDIGMERERKHYLYNNNFVLMIVYLVEGHKVISPCLQLQDDFSGLLVGLKFSKHVLHF